MKKLLLVLVTIVSSLFYLACSSEESVTISDRNTLAHRLSDPVEVGKGLYMDMMLTPEYTTFKISMTAFNNKLKNNTVTFDTRAEWINWIDTNVSLTEFTSKNEFETMYDDMASKFDDLVKQNEELFDIIAGSNAEQIQGIHQPEYDSYPVIGNPLNQCEEDCMDWFEGVEDLLRENLENAIVIANTATIPVIRTEALANAYASYDRAYQSNALLMNACFGTC